MPPYDYNGFIAKLEFIERIESSGAPPTVVPASAPLAALTHFIDGMCEFYSISPLGSIINPLFFNRLQNILLYECSVYRHLFPNLQVTYMRNIQKVIR